jgi:adenosylmethionine-8-amino-7-oxononanoate aminotransferase
MENNPVWHPYTQEKLYPLPLKVKRASDALIYLEDGTVLIDAVSSWWVNLFGHGRLEIAEAIALQAKELEHVLLAGFTHEPAIQLANGLQAVTHGHFSKVFYSDNGSTAVEVALKMALQFFYNKAQHKSVKVIAFEEAYHGDTFGAMSVGARSAFSKPFDDLLFEVRRLPRPNFHNHDEVLSAFETELKSGDVAAFIFEPLVMGTAGMKMYDASILDDLMKMAKEYGVILIADEVMTGFGRTGKHFACEYLKVFPDIMCLSKGITGGFLPLGVTLASDDIYKAFYSEDRNKTFFHGHSYTGNPIACAAANASLKLLLSDSMQKQMGKLSIQLTEIRHRLEQHSNAVDVRVKGNILAFEVKVNSTGGYFSGIRDRLYGQALSKGVLLRPLGNTLYTIPPYIVTEEQLKQIEKTFEYILDNN